MKKILAVAALAVTLGSGAAMADPITVTNVAMPYNDLLHINSAGGQTVNADGYVGQDVLTTNVGIIDAWCVDLFHDIYLGNSNYKYTITTLSSLLPDPTKQSLIGGLVNFGNNALADPTTLDKNDVAAAVQLAIWDIEYGTLSFNNGGNTVLQGLYDTYTTDPDRWAANAQGLSGLGGQQNLVTDAPEPASLAILGVGLLGLSIARRRRA